MLKKPFLLYILILLILSISSAILLMLPGITRQTDFTFIDALFTSVSSLTLTGLEITQTGNSFSLVGQTIILLLIQSGGLLYVISGLYFAYLLKIKLAILPDHQDGFSTKKVLRKISVRVITITFILEFAAFIAVFSLWARRLEIDSSGLKLFYSAFHAVSAFCNSGFILLENGFANPSVSELYVFHLALTAFMFLGALGFPAIYDLVSIKRLRDRMIDPERNWELNTRISLYAAFIFTIIGALLLYFSEQENTLVSQKTVEKVITTLFHSVSARSTGSVTLSGIAGNFVGYFFGRTVGARLFTKEDSLIFKKKYMTMTENFYQRHGAMAIIGGRFLPIIRTFVPILAGMIKLDFKKFVMYNVVGAILWVFSFTLAGYYLVKIFPDITKYLHYIIIGLIIVTIIPVIKTYLRERKHHAEFEKAEAENEAETATAKSEIIK